MYRNECKTEHTKDFDHYPFNNNRDFIGNPKLIVTPHCIEHEMIRSQIEWQSDASNLLCIIIYIINIIIIATIILYLNSFRISNSLRHRYPRI